MLWRSVIGGVVVRVGLDLRLVVAAATAVVIVSAAVTSSAAVMVYLVNRVPDDLEGLGDGRLAEGVQLLESVREALQYRVVDLSSETTGDHAAIHTE